VTLENKYKQTNPVGMVMVWNYTDRIDVEGAKKPNDTESNVIINSVSLRSMSTSKSKSSPAGSFELRLAPTFNWVTRITVGSWCVLLMSPEQDIPQTNNSAPGFVDPKTFKMLGRIDSVRMVVNVDQTTGARTTEYIIQGEDWGSVFNTSLYIDVIARNNNLEKGNAVGHAARILFDRFNKDWVTNGKGLPSATQIVAALIKLWGDPLGDIGGALAKVIPDLLFTSQSQFKLPLGVARYMGFKNKKGIPVVNMASAIHLVSGRLDGPDKYSGDPLEAFGIMDPRTVYGMHSFWQLLMDNCNPTINELIADIRFDKKGSAAMALYNRVRPFITRTGFKNDDVKKVTSLFKNVKKINIPAEEVISINAGTNWRDKVNFIEVLPQPNFNQTNFEVQVKLNSQEKDLKAFERDGFKPLIEKVKYMPYADKKPIPLEAVKWKKVLREWYFDTHNMLNGAVTFIGQREYIQVGDNIEIDSGIFGTAPFNKGQKKLLDSNNDTFLLAHVESVSHQFTVDNSGARSFFTTIQFSRGIIADSNGDPTDSAGTAIDTSSSALGTLAEKDTGDTISWSGESDPDKQKTRGT